jgi:ABC-type antimicrobial peptide transport system permease subunit
VATTYTRERQMTVILIVFAMTGTFLTGLGIYGVLSQRVRERAREIGIRLAVGGSRSHVMAWVAGSGVRLIAIGLGIGFAIAFGVARALDRFLFGVDTGDGVTVAAVLGGIAIVGIIGILEPLWRATRINPIDVLRSS